MQHSKLRGISGAARELDCSEGWLRALDNVIQPLRVALTGKTVSPGIDEVIMTLGKDRTLRRIRHALETTP